MDPGAKKHRRNTEKDGSGRPLYDKDQTIKGLLNDRFQMIRDKTGAEVVSSGFAKVLATVETDDKINGRLVIGRNILKDFDGQGEGRAVYLK